MDKDRVTYWIQRADFSSSDEVEVDLESAVIAFENHEWSQELQYEEQLTSNGSEACPPGIGFVSNNRILHICPTSGQNANYFFHFPVKRKLLWLIPVASQETTTRENINFSDCSTAIRKFFLNEDSYFFE